MVYESFWGHFEFDHAHLIPPGLLLMVLEGKILLLYTVLQSPYCRSLAAEWGHYGMRFNAIAPGPIETKVILFICII